MIYNETLDVKAALDCFFSIIKALHYINRSNVAHRDLKPENIMFPREMGRMPLVLIDFGATGKLENEGNFTEL